ncbi:MAG: ribonuclease H-like domain-containing protein [Candidatus Aquicultorales bacterium]
MELDGRAYLDIETSFRNKVTVVGIHRPEKGRFIHLVGDYVTPVNLLDALEGSLILVTYNGNRFDLPILNSALGIDLFSLFDSHDLMYDCWKCNLKGGLKAVEAKLGIERTIFGKDEDDPRVLWQRYRRLRDKDSLDRLLDYNRQDTVNLAILEERLFNLQPRGSHVVESHLVLA